MTTSNPAEDAIPPQKSKPTELVDLSNELITNIITNLDPPAAVCLGLTCKQMKTIVTTCCGRPLHKICVKLALEDRDIEPLAMLQDHCPSDAVLRTSRDVQYAVEYREVEREKDIGKYQLHTEYISLMKYMVFSAWVTQRHMKVICLCSGHIHLETDNYAGHEEWQECWICDHLDHIRRIRTATRHEVKDKLRSKIEEEQRTRIQRIQMADKIEKDGETDKTDEVETATGDDGAYGQQQDFSVRGDGDGAQEAADGSDFKGEVMGSDYSNLPLHEDFSVSDEQSTNVGEIDISVDEGPTITADDITAPIQRLSNELLINVVQRLNPPAALSLALTCSKFYSCIPDLCHCKIDQLCPALLSMGEAPPDCLANYIVTSAEQCAMLERSATASDLVQMMITSDIRALSGSGGELLTPEYHAFAKMLWQHRKSTGWPMDSVWTNACLEKGHTSIRLSPNAPCLICHQMGVLVGCRLKNQYRDRVLDAVEDNI